MNRPADKQPARPQPFLPRYEVLEPLGEGAVGTVHKVRSTKDGAIRALKSLKSPKPEQAQTAKAIAQFEDEFRILARLRHPSLPDVFDYGITDDETRYIVMELVEGVPLDCYFAEHRGDLWLLVYQLAEVLAFIHEHELLHLDLKPSNILVKKTKAFGGRESPLAMLIDFGLSYQRAEGGGVKRIGTVGYMPPEIIRGDDSPTRAADYYSLGAILYELVEEKLPFEGATTYDVLQAHLTKPVVFSQKKVEYAELYPWIEQLLAKEPGERLEAFQDFRRAVADRVVETPKGLDRAYALSYIESLGLIGKKDMWNDLSAWTESIASLKANGKKDMHAEKNTRQRVELDQPADDIDEKIRDELLASAVGSEADNDALVASQKRYVLMSGPGGCGKTFLAEILRADFARRGFDVFQFGKGGDYHGLMSESQASPRAGRSRTFDPSSIVVDKFVRAWELLLETTRTRTVMVLVDDFGRLDKEEREFLEYVIKRVELLTSQGKNPGLFFVIADENPKLRKDLAHIIPRDEETLSIEIPPPRNEDVETLLASFHGHMSGADERRALGEFLAKNMESDGAIMLSLRQAIADKDLSFDRGRWRFTGSAARAPRRLTNVDYYQHLLADLPDNVASLLRWLCCHRGSLSTPQIEDLTGMDAADISDALDYLKPYRIVEVIEDTVDERVAIVSEDIRQAIYRNLDAERRSQIHALFIDYLSGYQDASLAGVESLMFHYEGAAQHRHALLARLSALSIAKRTGDIFSTRRLCEGGIAYVERIDAQEWAPRKWHIERFFIKNLIELEWSLSNYGALVNRIDEVFGDMKDVPLSFAYKYATALERIGDPKRSQEMIAASRTRIGEADSEYLSQLLVAEAAVYHMLEHLEPAREILATIDDDALRTPERARVLSLRMQNAQWLGDWDEYDQYRRMAIDTSAKHGHYDQLLMAYYSKIMVLFNASRYEEAKREIRKCLRLAARHRLYRMQCSTYFVASAVYYEEGNYRRALRYLDRASRLATDVGLEDSLDLYTLRYAMIYQNLGLYGTAIRHVTSVERRLSPVTHLRRYFESCLVLFELLVSVHSGRAAEQNKQVTDLVSQIKYRPSLAYYYRILGNYYHAQKESEDALREYRQARSLYAELKYDDDVARTDMMMAQVALAMGGFDRADSLIESARQQVDTLESEDIKQEYRILKLSRLLVAKATGREIQELVDKCEAHRAVIRDFNVALKTDAALFWASVELEDADNAFQNFDLYYSKVKTLCSNLPDAEYVSDYVGNPEFVAIVQEFKRIKKRTQARDR